MWTDQFDSQPIFFVTPDLRRALGVHDQLKEFHIICSYNDPLIPILRRQGTKIFCLEEIEIHGTDNSGKLLEHPQVREYIQRSSTNPAIMFFKPSRKLDLLIKELGAIQIGNTSELNEQFENKVLFHSFMQKYCPEYAIPSLVGILGELEYNNLTKVLTDRFVIQFGHGWAGKTTFIITTESDFLSIREQYPYTNVKVSKFIDSISVLNNCCIYQDEVLVSPPATQLSGIADLTDKTTVTCGRQWPAIDLEPMVVNDIQNVSKTIGTILMSMKYKGYFGIDFLVNSQGKVYISELNARMTASSGFYTRLELAAGRIPLLGYHIAAFAGRTLPVSPAGGTIIGSQITLRSPQYTFPQGKTVLSIYHKDEPSQSLVTYQPEQLLPGSALVMGRGRMVEQGDESGRIETRESVLQSAGVLTPWVSGLLQTLRS